MNMIEKIKADREQDNGLPFRAIGCDCDEYCCHDLHNLRIERRKNRVPGMEAALIAAFDALVSNIEMDDDGLTGFVPIEEINKFRAAIGAT